MSPFKLKFSLVHDSFQWIIITDFNCLSFEHVFYHSDRHVFLLPDENLIISTHRKEAQHNIS